MEYSLYFAGVALGVCAGCILTAVRMRKRQMAARAVLWTVLFAVLLGAVGARAYYIINYYVLGSIWEEYGLLSDKPYEYAVCGAVLGVMAGCGLASLVGRVPLGRILDAAAPGGLLALAAARTAELFADFGWGRQIMDPGLQFFPLALRDEFGEWYGALNLLEAAFALGVFALLQKGKRRQEGADFAVALLWWSMSQILCESLRGETLRWGFVRVQQVQCAVFGAGVLLWAEWKTSGDPAGRPLRLAGYLAGVAAVTAVEFILDRWDWPRWADYLGMAAVLAFMGAMVHRRILRMGPAAAKAAGGSAREKEGTWTDRKR